jgi:hypothetical protein
VSRYSPRTRRSPAGSAGPASRAASLATEGLRALAVALDQSGLNVQVGAPPAGLLLNGLSGSAGSLAIENIHVVDRSASRFAGTKSDSSHDPNHMRPADGGAFILPSQSRPYRPRNPSATPLPDETGNGLAKRAILPLMAPWIGHGVRPRRPCRHARRGTLFGLMIDIAIAKPLSSETQPRGVLIVIPW